MSMQLWWQIVGIILFFLVLATPIYFLTAEPDEEGGEYDSASYGQDGGA